MNKAKNDTCTYPHVHINELFWSYFVLANYSRVRGLPCSVVDILSKTPLEKADFLFASRYQLQIPPSLGMELCVHFPTPC